MKVSNCCGVIMNSMWLDYEMCPGCHEHCGVEEEAAEEEIIQSSAKDINKELS